MSPWTRRRHKSDYAEWFPELDLYVARRWVHPPPETRPERMQVVTHVDFVADENELKETLAAG
jgi:hypothetical protein